MPTTTTTNNNNNNNKGQASGALKPDALTSRRGAISVQTPGELRSLRFHHNDKDKLLQYKPTREAAAAGAGAGAGAGAKKGEEKKKKA
ncbi:hypothetical protein NEMBOFW57_001498 [Staphylotrichum longicolle]|uniref:Uncharacterized protein n=1 Tax=Staphylotrichum longicolle TaxID=669026 RepID=A0AAD4F1M5_9PEZI|nr:hypothetical protein NEMBOFW57_001498 [Staphylotrichum longicolle]